MPRESKRKFALFFTAALSTLTFVGSLLHARDLEVHFLNLGHGDCSLVRTPRGKYILIDTGLGIMSFKLKRYLRKLEVRSIELLMVTHPHPDHYGGAKTVIRNFRVKEFVDPGIPTRSRSYASLLKLVRRQGIRHTIARRGKQFAVDGVALEVLSPPDRLFKNVRSAGNANSLVLRLTSENLRILFTGDIEAETERFLVASGDDLSCDILKVPHHGVSTSSTAAFLDATRPRCAVITCAYYAEPSRVLYDRFRKRSIAWFRNDANGTVVFRSRRNSPAPFLVSFERGHASSRLKVAPDWYKTLQQVKALPARAKTFWKKGIREKAQLLARRVREKYDRRKEEFRARFHRLRRAARLLPDRLLRPLNR